MLGADSLIKARSLNDSAAADRQTAAVRIPTAYSAVIRQQAVFGAGLAPSCPGAPSLCLTSRREIANHGPGSGFQDGPLRLQVGAHPSMLTGTKRRLANMREDALLMLLIVMPIMVAILAFGSVALFHLV
jgi:hypothetical protein